MKNRQSQESVVVSKQISGSRGFTLMELLVVIVVIVTLMALLFPALQGARQRARYTRAHSEIMTLHQAWLAYWNAYGEFPSGTEMDSGLVAILNGDNPNRIAFMEFDNRARGRGMLDPWGRPYQVNFDSVVVTTDPFVYQTRVTLLHGL